MQLHTSMPRIDEFILIIAITATFLSTLLPGPVWSFLTLLRLSARLLTLNLCGWLCVILFWRSLPLNLLLRARDNRRVLLAWQLDILLPVFLPARQLLLNRNR
jgi:hypothetical protein